MIILKIEPLNKTAIYFFVVLVPQAPAWEDMGID